MATERQIAAYRANSQRSTGPQTDHGTARSSMNSTTHGCYSKTINPITRGPFAENPDAIVIFVEELIANLAPRDALERAAARQIAELWVKVERAGRFESEALATASSPHPDLPPASNDAGLQAGGGASAAISEVLLLTLRIDSHLSRRLDEALARYEILRGRHLPAASQPDDETDGRAKRTQSDDDTDVQEV